MIEWPLIMFGGLLGSSHCVGMCGGFALTIGLGARGVRHNIARQFVYSAGRIFTYAFLGSIAGFAGFWFARRTGVLMHFQAGLSVAAGLILVVQGLLALGVSPFGSNRKTSSIGAGPSCLAGSFVGPFLASPRWHHVFIAGMLNGLLPCGLVYGYLALASSTASLPIGMATMAAFGAGTMPAMVVTGAGASIVSFALRRRILRVAGVFVLLTGLLAVARGAVFWNHGSSPRCPGCMASEGSSLVSGLSHFTLRLH